MTQLQLHQTESQVTFYSWSTESFWVFFNILPNPVLSSINFFLLLEKSENLALPESLCAYPYINGEYFGSPVLK